LEVQQVGVPVDHHVATLDVGGELTGGDVVAPGELARSCSPVTVGS
jgi:hypothetical protein